MSSPPKKRSYARGSLKFISLGYTKWKNPLLNVRFGILRERIEDKGSFHFLFYLIVR